MNKRSWIRVEDRLPEEGQNCVVYITETYNEPGWLIESGIYNSKKKCWEYASGEYSWEHDKNTNDHIVTHWMPMPDPPEKELIGG